MLVITLLGVIAATSIARDFVFPYRTTSVQQHRDFARWFWQTNEREGKTLCWETDIDEGRLSPVAQTPVAALYLCNREIYSRRWDETPATSDKSGPLRCVRFSSFEPTQADNICQSEADDKAFAAWLEGMQTNYNLVSQQTYELPISNRRHARHAQPLCIDTITVYEFVPK